LSPWAAVAVAVALAALAVEWVALEWAVAVTEVSSAVMVVIVAIKDKVPCKDMVPWANQLTNTRTSSRTSINTKTIMERTHRLNHIMAPVMDPATMAKALKMAPAMVQIRPDNC
jgi:hypothetical protein